VSGGVGGETPREVAVFGLQRKRPVGSVRDFTLGLG
jgi:hypothetical protein